MVEGGCRDRERFGEDQSWRRGIVPKCAEAVEIDLAGQRDFCEPISGLPGGIGMKIRAIAHRPLLASCLMASVAVAEPPPLSVYGALPSVEDMSISPDGKNVATVARLKEQRQLLVIDTEHKARVALPVGDLKLRGLSWAGPERVILKTSSTQNLGPGFTEEKHEFYGATVIPIKDGKVFSIYDGFPHLAHTIVGDYGSRLIDGRWVGYYGGIEFKRSPDLLSYEFDHGRPALFGVDLTTKRPTKISRPASENGWRDWLIDAGGKIAATLDFNSSSGNWRVTGPSGAPLASGKDPTGDVSLLSLGHDGSSVVYSLEDDTSGLTRWFEAPLAGGAPQEILANVGVERVYVDPTNGRMLGYLERGAPQRPVLFDAKQQSVLTKVYNAFPKSHLLVAEWTPDFAHVLVHTSGNGDSGTWYTVDVAQRRADPVGYDYPTIGPEHVGPISTVAYRAADGLEMEGVLTLPPGREAKNLPVIMLPHGGPHAHDEAMFDWWPQAFASRGYAVFQPNFRGSTNRDSAFRRAGYGQWGRKMQSDISDGLAELARRGVVDAKRACIVGASYGGYAALAGVTLQKGLYRCAVAVAGVSDLSDMYWTDYRESGQSTATKRSLQESLGSPAGFAAVSPRKHAREADAPILLIHGKDDTVVPLKQSTAMADALKDAGKPHELVVMPGEDHWLSRSASRLQMLEASVAFVQKHNPAN
jgi:dienelactone hydrolase